MKFKHTASLIILLFAYSLFSCKKKEMHVFSPKDYTYKINGTHYWWGTYEATFISSGGVNHYVFERRHDTFAINILTDSTISLYKSGFLDTLFYTQPTTDTVHFVSRKSGFPYTVHYNYSNNSIFYHEYYGPASDLKLYTP